MSDNAWSTAPTTRLDTMFGGKLLLHQMTRGHRAGTDAVLLAAVAGVRPGDRFIDVGAGTGAVGLGLAIREPDAYGSLLEIDTEAAAIAARNVEANRMRTRVSVCCADLFNPAACQAADLTGTANLVVSNPPFYAPATVRPSPHAGRAAAHVARSRLEDTHAEWLKRCIALLAPHGRLVVIHRPEALASLLQAAERRLGGLIVRPVHARADTKAIRILFGGILGTRAPLALLPPLVLHQADGTFTVEAEALSQGGVTAFWPY